MVLPMAFFGFGDGSGSFVGRWRGYGIQEGPEWIFVFRCGPLYVDDGIEFGSSVGFMNGDRHDAGQSPKLNKSPGGEPGCMPTVDS